VTVSGFAPVAFPAPIALLNALQIKALPTGIETRRACSTTDGSVLGGLIMDRHFLEFLGNFLTSAAKGQKQIEDMNQWVRQSFSGFEYLTSMFQKFYGLDASGKDTPENKPAWQIAEENFRSSFKDYLKLMDVIPKDEHLKLAQKYEDLKKKVAEQEKTINYLETLLGQKVSDLGETVNGFQEMMESQTEAFMELMDRFGQLYKNGSSTSDEIKEKK
jgi:uncharacterized coiled-coil protein SlyX